MRASAPGQRFRRRRRSGQAAGRSAGPPSSRRLLVGGAFAVGALAMLVSACYHASFDLIVEDDGSGSMSGTIYVERTVTELALDMDSDLGVTFEDLCATMDTAPFGADETTDGNGYVSESELVVDEAGCEATLRAEWTADRAESLMTGLGPDGGPLLERSDGGWRFELDMGVVRDLFGLDRNADLFTLVVDQPTLTVSVTLPGQASEHNADARDGSTYRWLVVLSDVESMPDTLYAGAAPDSGSGALMWLVVSVVVAVLLIGAIAVLVRRRSEAANRAADTAAGSADSGE